MSWKPSTSPKTIAKWRKHVDDQAVSGESVREYAKRRPFGPGTLYQWRRWFRQQDARGPAPSMLVPVRLEDVVTAQQFTTMIVELENRRRVHVEPGFDAAALTRLVAVMEAL